VSHHQDSKGPWSGHDPEDDYYDANDPFDLKGKKIHVDQLQRIFRKYPTVVRDAACRVCAIWGRRAPGNTFWFESFCTFLYDRSWPITTPLAALDPIPDAVDLKNPLWGKWSNDPDPTSRQWVTGVYSMVIEMIGYADRANIERAFVVDKLAEIGAWILED
jgi:hypothetical protein